MQQMVIFGHTHEPHHRIPPSGWHAINEGSAGKPIALGICVCLQQPSLGYWVVRTPVMFFV